MVASGLAIALFLNLLIRVIVADKRRAKGYSRTFWCVALGGFGTALGVGYLYYVVPSDLGGLGVGFLFAVAVAWQTHKIFSAGMRVVLFLILWIAATAGGIAEGWSGEKTSLQNFVREKKEGEIDEITAAKRALRDSLERIHSRSRDSVIAVSWRPLKKIRYEDSFDRATETYSYLEIEKNSVTGEYRVGTLRNGADSILSKRSEFLKELAEGVERYWRRPVERESIFVATADGDRQFVGIDSDPERRESGLRTVCNTKVKSSSDKGFNYTEYEACLRTATIAKKSFTSMELCGTGTAQLYSDPNRLYEFTRPPGCPEGAVPSP